MRHWSVQDSSAEGRATSRELVARASECLRLSIGEDHPNFKTISTFMDVVESYESEAVDVVVYGLFGALGDGGGGNGRGMWFQDAEKTQDGGAAVGFEGVGGNLAKEVGGGRVETSVSRGVVEHGEYCAGEDQFCVLGQVRGGDGDVESGGRRGA